MALDGASITIRKFRKDKLSMQQLVEFGSLTPPMAEFLRACVISRLNIIVSGGTGSGKTTLLNVLSSLIPESERIVTIEDAAELQLQQEHIVRLETKVASFEGKGQVSIRDLVRNSLRMRPDRIIVGECRGGETLDMLQAMNTGHSGSLGTIHANSPIDALRRFESLVVYATSGIDSSIIREQINSAVEYIIQLHRASDGMRRIIAVSEVLNGAGAEFKLIEKFRFNDSERGWQCFV